jgi:hypothetical protein
LTSAQQPRLLLCAAAAHCTQRCNDRRACALQSRGVADIRDEALIRRFFAPTFGERGSHKSKLHVQSMSNIAVVPKQDRYLSFASEGTVAVWNGSGVSSAIHKAKELPYLSYGTLLSSTPKSDHVLLAGSNQRLYFYNVSFEKMRFEGKVHMEGAVTYMDTYSHTQGVRSLCLGDESGYISSFKLDKLVEIGTSGYSNEVPRHAEELRVKTHKDRVNKMAYCSELMLLLSASADGTIAMTDLDMPTRARTVLSGQHKKGVNSFCYIPSLNYLATVGLERHINLWNPNIPTRPIFQLSGHKGSICDVLVDPDDSQLFSLCVDKTVKVWDLRTNRCLQVAVAPRPASPKLARPVEAPLRISAAKSQSFRTDPCLRARRTRASTGTPTRAARSRHAFARIHLGPTVAGPMLRRLRVGTRRH